MEILENFLININFLLIYITLSIHVQYMLQLLNFIRSI